MDPNGFEAWAPRLRELGARLRRAARAHLDGRAPDAGLRPVRRGAGDLTFAVDEAAEAELERWLDEVAARAPLSLLTEDAGWRHRGPGPRGPRELDGFDHGGPRIAVDPVDGTRNVMADLRSAWAVLAFAAPGAAEPRLADVVGGVLCEIPPRRAAAARELWAPCGGPLSLREVTLADERAGPAVAVRADDDARCDHGYFPFFRYLPEERPALARVEAAFFRRLVEAEGADPRSLWDDQYICNAGQLVLLALGTYRMVCDLRAWLAAREGRPPVVTTKPYDVAGAIACARAAGCVVTAPPDGTGSELDFPLDARTPVSFVGWANEATRARLEPHLTAALRET